MKKPDIAPDGKIWVCMTCFAKHKDRAEIKGTAIHNDYCYVAAVLCDEVQPAPGFYVVSEPTRD